MLQEFTTTDTPSKLPYTFNIGSIPKHKELLFQKLIIKGIIKPDMYSKIEHKIEWYPRDININLNIDKRYIHQAKGGNFISSPDNIIFSLKIVPQILKDEIMTQTGQSIVELSCSFMLKIDKIEARHIDELMCFMPYGIKQYKIWFYDFTPKYKETHPPYEIERITNLNIISTVLFGTEYANNIDKFFFVTIYIDDIDDAEVNKLTDKWLSE
jgi:hypothetical protein